MFRKKKENSCYTYFYIQGDFDPDTLNEMLGLVPFEVSKKGDCSAFHGEPYTASTWAYGRCDEYDVLTENQMMKTISDLIPKIDTLNEIREKFDVMFYLEVVPEIYARNVKPSLAPNMEVIDFCHKTRTKLDIDLYVYG